MIPSKLISAIKEANHITVLTGAGISAESGVPTFRDAQTGLWAQYRPEELATPEAFQRNPKLVWEWYAWRRELVSNAQPNSGHLALVDLEKWVPRFSLITQNVDSLHERAGSNNVIELHGNIMRTKCLRAGHIIEGWDDSLSKPPLCPQCQSKLRPDVVWFGEMLPQHALSQAITASQSCDLFLSIGTSALVQPAASLPLEALQRGALVAEINLQPTPLSETVDFVLKGQASVILSEILAQL